jgi:group II intron reverse transcriptase/maturase
MREAAALLEIIRKRGEQGLPLERVYRLLYNRDLFLLAYGKIYRNKGATTPGSTPETVDEMSISKIDAIIEALRFERYRWTPTRRIYIEKKHSTKKRPLSMPTWSDKLLQEVLRLILESYFEPSFSEHSHGFRPGRGCHTALREIDQTWLGSVWFIEGDIADCFGSLEHTILLTILAEHIHDERFLRLIKGLLQAGYLEEWRYNATLSGAPQGGIISPILSNIYLDQFDKYIEQVLMPAHTKGDKRKDTIPYHRLISLVYVWRKKGKRKEANVLRKQAQRLPAFDPTDPDYRRLKYVRYADDWCIGYIGTKAEAIEIKNQIRDFLHKELGLTLSEEKTLLTHAKTETARFLGYHISIMQDNSYRTGGKKRNANGKVKLSVPLDVLKQKCQKYQRRGKPIHRPELTNNTIYSIVAQYQSEYRGVVEYYQLANDIYKFNRLKWVMETSRAPCRCVWNACIMQGRLRAR